MGRIAVTVAGALLLSGAAWAQDDDSMDFAPEDLDDEGGEGDGEMSFEVDEGEGEGDAEAGEMTFETEGGETQPRAVVLVIPSPGSEPELAQRLSDALEKYVQHANKFEILESDEFRAQLFGPGEAGAMDCATNAVCLSGYGKELWIDTLFLGVLYKGAGGWRVEANKVGVDRAEVEGYAHQEDNRLDRRGALELDDLATKMGAQLLGITYGPGDDAPRTKLVPMRGPMQTNLAIGTAGLAALAAGAAGWFSFQARNTEARLGEDSLRQPDAPALVDEGESQARSAQLFLGVALVAAAGSAALFLIKPLQEVEFEAERPTPGFDDAQEGSPSPSRSRQEPDFSLLPRLDLLGTGFSLSWSMP